jgi:hypothetical protein
VSDEEAPEAFQIVFKLPDYNITKRHLVGARGQIDILKESVAAWNALADYASDNPMATFAAAIVVVVTYSDGEKLPEPIRVRGWKELKN